MTSDPFHCTSVWHAQLQCLLSHWPTKAQLCWPPAAGEQVEGGGAAPRGSAGRGDGKAAHPGGAVPSCEYSGRGGPPAAWPGQLLCTTRLRLWWCAVFRRFLQKEQPQPAWDATLTRCVLHLPCRVGRRGKWAHCASAAPRWRGSCRRRSAARPSCRCAPAAWVCAPFR